MFHFVITIVLVWIWLDLAGIRAALEEANARKRSR